jgi:hypothetical protein
MTPDEFRQGLHLVKEYWPQWRERLDKPDAQPVWLRFYTRLKGHGLGDFERGAIRWLETRHTTPTIENLAEMAEHCRRLAAHQPQKGQRDRSTAEAVRQWTEPRSESDLKWAELHCRLVQSGLARPTPQSARAAADLCEAYGADYPELEARCRGLAREYRLRAEALDPPIAPEPEPQTQSPPLP